MLRRITVSFALALMMMAGLPLTSMLATCPWPSMVMGFVIVTPPKPPGSRASVSPPAAVFEIAPANVLHGAVRLHGLTSSPTPETQVRVACAQAGIVTEAASVQIKTVFRD